MRVKLNRLGFEGVGHDFFQWTKRMFSQRNHDTFCDYIYPEWKGKPTNYLEIGVFEGMSMTWMMMHTLTHPASRAVGIDPWLMVPKITSSKMEDVMNRAYHNTSPWLDRCKLIRGVSDMVLRAMSGRVFPGIENGHFDLCMIDGSHSELCVWNDARLVLPLLRNGGWMMFDDVESDPAKARVKKGIDAFVGEVGDQVKLIWKHKHMECYQRMR